MCQRFSCSGVPPAPIDHRTCTSWARVQGPVLVMQADHRSTQPWSCVVTCTAGSGPGSRSSAFACALCPGGRLQPAHPHTCSARPAALAQPCTCQPTARSCVHQCFHSCITMVDPCPAGCLLLGCVRLTPMLSAEIHATGTLAGLLHGCAISQPVCTALARQAAVHAPIWDLPRQVQKLPLEFSERALRPLQPLAQAFSPGQRRQPAPQPPSC